MDDEFKLCWKNFQDNIASGFQSLYDRGDLVDVTLACDGKLLQAHKIVLAICSPYFQEIFITNPCKHPIIILKDVSYTIMCELLEFMYQGVVNVKHTELQAFMKIGQLLQIKGLATNTSSSSAGHSLSEKSNSNANANEEREPSQPSSSPPKSAASPNIEAVNHNENPTNNSEKQSQTNTSATTSSNTPQRIQSPDMSSPASPSLNISSVSQKQSDSHLHQNFHSTAGSSGLKRHLSDFNSDSLSIYSRNKSRRATMPTDQSSDNNEGSDVGGSSSMDQMNAEDFFMPHMSMVEGRYDINSVKREGSEHHLNTNSSSSAAAAAAAAASLRNSFNPAAFGLDYTFYKNSNSGSASTMAQEFPNELNISGSDYSKGFANHMDIPPNCPNVVMLSSTSLLHGNCVFNRNNTVATQQGMKTYWLCKSYRISMCRARCITHQGKIISATGVHNHPPHMRGNNAGAPSMNEVNVASSSSTNISGGGPPPGRFSQNLTAPSGNIFQTNFHGPHHGHPVSPSTPPSMQHSTFSTAEAAGAMNPNSSHHFVQMTPSLGQHQLTNLHPPPPPQLPNTTMHAQSHGSYEISPTSSADHNRISNAQVYDGSGKSQKALLNDDHITVQNAAELSPPSHHMHDEGDHQQNDKSSTEHHHSQQQRHNKQQHEPVLVIDSITISPGGHSGHNFKMEPL
ncbi:uncharacterized protein isoform X1 [Musca autumnalis]|uniref:uncharacterized protein isoform X1 n=1 Tax=Musca autumnalis TaxID=221902 RepID=UPI003CEB5A88